MTNAIRRIYERLAMGLGRSRRNDSPKFNTGVSFRRIDDGTWLVRVNERIVEIPFAFAAISSLPVGSRVLELGPAQSLVALSLASLGYHVHGIDLRAYGLSHPNLRTTIADFTEMQSDEQYDAFLAISAIEHSGLEFYGGDVYERSDARIMERARRLLRPGGLIVLTVPFGKRMIVQKGGKPFERVYDPKDLSRLLAGTESVEKRFFRTTDFIAWVEVDEEIAATTDNARHNHLPHEAAVACVVARNAQRLIG